MAASPSAPTVGRSTVQSFDHRSLWAVHKIEPTVELVALEKERGATPFSQWVDGGASVWSPNETILDEALIDAAHEAGLAVVPWTVNDVKRMTTLKAMGVDGLISDRPDLFEMLD